MKTSFFSIFFLISFNAFSKSSGTTDVVETKVRDVFIVQGFDDNDEVTVTLDGFLPNNCYQLMRPEFTVTADRQIFIRQPARQFKEMACLQALVPFTSTVELGQLPKGQYEINANGRLLKKTLIVKEATNKLSPDDDLYAPVEDIAVEFSQGQYWIVLGGRFTNTCMSLNAENVEIRKSGTTIVALPIMGEDSSKLVCADKVTPFVIRKPIGDTLSPNRYLVHVRSLNGRGLNRVFSVYSYDRP